MRIKKLGHCCLVIEENGVKVMTDPGSFSSGMEEETDIALIVITHEHGDHLHVPAVQSVLERNPGAVVVGNSAVAALLHKEEIACTVVEGSASETVAGVALHACDGKHEEIFEDIGQVQNTGYRIGERLFYPGDSFTVPEHSVDVLALPVAGLRCLRERRLRRSRG
jgi:L-ascorbate metabolism protein UlaG (beta-lactamase superfamily)